MLEIEAKAQALFAGSAAAREGMRVSLRASGRDLTQPMALAA